MKHKKRRANAHNNNNNDNNNDNACSADAHCTQPFLVVSTYVSGMREIFIWYTVARKVAAKLQQSDEKIQTTYMRENSSEMALPVPDGANP